MACLINRNSQGMITSVVAPSGENSKLFQAIHEIPFLGDTDLSVKIMSSAYSEDIENMFKDTDKFKYDTGEPQLFFQGVDNNVYEDLEEALLEGGVGNVTIGYKNPKNENFIPVSRFNTEASENSRFISSQILEGVLSPQRVLGEDGITRLQGKGEYEETKEVTAKLFQTEALLELGIADTKINKDGTIEVVLPTDTVQAVNKDGTVDNILIDDVPNAKKDYENLGDLLLEFATKNNNLRPLTKKQQDKLKKIDVKTLETTLLNFLKSIGFTATSLEDYQERYKTVYGTDPDIEALTDIANKIVAFAEGRITEENLSEEVAHIALAAYHDQNSIVSALANVEFTPEYYQYADMYRKKYGKFYEGVELEDQVRKEILGKILAKQLQNNFNTQGLTQEQSYLVSLLREIWNKIKAFFQKRNLPSHQKQINELTKKISDSILSNSLQDFENDLSENKDFYYSLMSKNAKALDLELMVARKALEGMFKANRERVPRQNELDKIYNGMDEIDILRSINVIVDIANNQMGILEVATTEADQNNEVLSQQDANRYNTLSQNILPILNSLKASIETAAKEGKFSKENEAFVKLSVDTINDIWNRMSSVQPIIDRDLERLVEEKWEKEIGSKILDPDAKRREKAKLDGGFKDTSFFGQIFGLMTASENPIMQMLAMAVVKMRQKVNRAFRETVNPIVEDVYRKGLQKYQGSIIQRDEKGKATYFYFSPIDWTQLEKEEEDAKIKKAAELTGLEEPEVSKKAKNFSFREIIGDENKYKDFLEFTRELRKNNDEQRFTEEYYKEGDKRFTDVKVADYTRETLRNLNSRAFEVYRKAMDSSGQIDKSLLSKADKKALFDIRRDKEAVRNPYNVFGELREGLRIVRATDLTQEDYAQLKNFGITDLKGYSGDIIMLDKGKNLDDLPEDSRMALDINNLGLYYRQERAGGRGEATTEFKDKLKAEGYEWAMANATLTLSDEFYESIGTTTNYNKKVEDYIASVEDEDLKADLELKYKQYSEANRKRKNILKQNKRLTNPIEVDAKNMHGETMKVVRDLDTQIKEYRKELNKTLPEDFFETEEEEMQAEGEITSIKELNDDYAKMLKERGISEYDFCIEHMSLADRLRTERFASQITALIKGNRLSIDPSFESFFAKMVEEDKVVADVVDGQIQNKEEVINTLINTYARQNVASYFQRFAPEGYGQFLASMENGTVDMLDVLEGNVDEQQYPVAKYFTLIPDYTWTKDIANEKFLNSNYKKGGYYRKPKERFLNEKWFEHYGINKEDYLALEDDDISKLTATKNQEEFEFLKTVIGLREKELENYNDTDKVNKWMRVQKSKDSFEKVFSKENLTSVTAAKASLKDAFSDIIKNRPDELDYGMQVEGEDVAQVGSEINVKMIPKYYQTRLEDPEIITENTFEAAVLSYRQSLLHKERVASERSLKALEWKAANQRFKNSKLSIKSRILKKGSVTNYAQKAKEYLDHQLYGIQQSRSFKTQILGKEVDLTRLATSVQGFARFTNLAFNLYVDATGATTGALNKALDTLVGDYYHKRSAKRANSQFLTLSADYVKEIATVDKKSKLNALMEEFDIVDPAEKFIASKYGRASKIAKRSPYLLSKASNMTITPRILLSILNDYRLVDGQFRSFNDFKILRKEKDIKTIEAEWSLLEKESLYDYLDIKDNNVKTSDRFNALFENPQEVYEDLNAQITAKAKLVVQNVDSVLNEVDQVAAQRDVLTNAFMMHRGWFLINWQRRFKPRNFNLATSQYEEGHYITLVNAFKRTLNPFKKGPDKESWKEYAASLEDFEKKNIKRALAEAGLLMGILILGEAILAADDDDDTWIEDFGRLIYLRTASEFASAQPFAMPNALREMVSSPFPALKTYEMLDPTYHIMEGWKSDNKYGIKSIKKIIKGSPLRRYEQYGDIQKQIEAFRHFNDPTLFNLGESKKDDTAGMLPDVKIR